MSACLLWVLILGAVFWPNLTNQSPSAFLHNYETLNYNHHRVKRSVERDQTLRLDFRSHGKEFRLRLKRDTSVFAPDALVDENGVKLGSSEQPIDLSFLYDGYLEGDRNSHVYGSVLDGVFDGHIHSGDKGLFHVERASKYFDPAIAKTAFHSLIYNDNDIKFDEIHQERPKRSMMTENIPKSGESPHPGCPLDGELKREMEEIQNSAVDPLSENLGPGIQNSLPERETPFDRYLPSNKKGSKKRSRRRIETESIGGRKIYTVRTCSLYMQADHKLWEQVFLKEGAGDVRRTREEILSMFHSHVKAVNHIYESTSFGGITGVNFMVQRTSIHTNSSCVNVNEEDEEGNPFCEERVDVSNYLNLNSKRNHSAFCLAYAITYRDFIGGTLGLAWVASPQPSTAGGICEIFKEYAERRGRVKRSLNTGIITLVNYGNRVPPRVSQLTLAHEIGHNFGSPHDYPERCQPGLPHGNYIMFASATSGDKENNAKFSDCSTSNISSVLFSVLKEHPVDPQKTLNPFNPGGKRNCLSERTTAFCGNQLVEEGEMCDCGFDDDECTRMKDRCCHPHRNHVGAKGCTLKQPQSDYRCSPSQGPCCNANCFPQQKSTPCSQADDCNDAQVCNGVDPWCPKPTPKRDGTPCQNNTKVCRAGNCNASICEEVGLKECFITEGSPESKCQLACLKDKKCLPADALDELARFYTNKNDEKGAAGIRLRPGAPCDNYRGYCDIFLKCRSVDSNGPLSRLKNLLFNNEFKKAADKWAKEYWWALVLMLIGLVLFMALFIKCCAIHTPSTNPRKAPAHSIYETLRRPTTLMRNTPGSRHHGHRHHHHRHGRSRSSHARSVPAPDDAAAVPGPSTSSGAAGASAPPPISAMEPPPSYAAAVGREPATYGGGPPRGHRKNKNRDPTNRANMMEMRPKRV